LLEVFFDVAKYVEISETTLREHFCGQFEYIIERSQTAWESLVISLSPSLKKREDELKER